MTNKVVFVLSIILIGSFVKGVHAKYVQRRNVRTAQMYPTKYDNVDVNGILSSNRLLRNYVNCLLDKGPCTNEGNTLKQYIPDAIATECSKCSPTQKKIAGRILYELLLNHRPEWDLLTAKYDPDEKYQKKYFSEDVDYSEYEEA
ncbi:hypothetical protein ABEB36_009425 [Hypothenemus hampei]|uniref:Uncharacterized protein n=1 Tax=Hypothenemus hampei TaxID=57062 RepID=A0ABD1EGC5_HYPHA